MRTLVILAGGKSTRMGQDKVLLELNGMTFIERIFKNALICFEQIIISTDTAAHAKKIQSLPGFASQNAVFVTDRYEAKGPMGGILSVFEETDTDRFSIISVDVPFADMNVLAALYDRCSKKAAFLKIGNGRAEPLIASYSRSAYRDLKTAFEQGLYKMRLALDEDDIDIITSDSLVRENPQLAGTDFAEAFGNYNTQDELRHIAGR